MHVAQKPQQRVYLGDDQGGSLNQSVVWLRKCANSTIHTEFLIVS